MNQQIKEKWVSALRSGEYKQGTDFLKTPDGRYCCLGVLCDIYYKETHINVINMYDIHLPETVIRWASVDSGNPFIIKEYRTLADLNDSGKSFGGIADIIEKYL